MLEEGGTALVGAKPGGSARITAYRWGRRAVLMRRLLIDPFELKFEHLNTNSTI
jgi:hypothetical protein